jgi:hypothetical protein
MKNVSKLVAVAVLSAGMLFASQAKAQMAPATTPTPSPVQVNIGIEGGVVSGRETSEHGAILGGAIQLEKFTGPSFAMTLSTGFDHFFDKTDAYTGADYPNLDIIPVKLGIKEFFVPNVYIGAEVGAGFVLLNGNVKFIGTPAIGWTSPDHAWDVSARFENYFGTYDYGFFGLRLSHSL